MAVPRAANPVTNPNGYLAAVGAVIAAAVMIYNGVSHHGLVDATVIASGVTAFLALISRQYTPVADPRDGNGKALAAPPEIPAAPAAPAPVSPAQP
jgi:hypothetical protein